MEELDGDDVRLSYGGKTASRDIVQFVPFRNYLGVNPAKLARDVLEELPAQVVEYYSMRKLKPNPPSY